MSKRIAALFIIILILFVASPAHAQNYSFSLDSEVVHVYWQENGTLSLIYELNFSNDSFADPIDFVDIGLPNSNYSLANISASINGRTISHIAYSDYVDGIELGLGANAIIGGHSGQVIVQITGISNILYNDDDDESFASAVFSPSWFDSGVIHGTTDLSVIFHLPPGVQPDEPRWHAAPSGFPSQPETSLDSTGRVTYTWRNSNANGYTQYRFGASFPKVYVPAGAISSAPLIQIDFEALIAFGMFCIFALFIFGIPILSIVVSRRRKMKYLPPKVAIEGHGIKRGLTAIEAAILLEEPMDKILTMILFASIKKGAAKVTKRDPLTLEVTDPIPDNLRKYEIKFLEAFKEEIRAKRKKSMQTTMVTLIKSVTRKMKGFSRRETRRYYRDIMQRAWAQVEAAETPEVMSKKYDEVMEWTMLDKDYEDRTRNIFTGRPVFVPLWWHNYDPGYSRSTVSRPTSAPTSRGSGASLPRLPGSDFAASVVNGVQDFSAGVIGSVRDFTSGVTQKTNPPPVS
ncbi:MAG: hypothetical protein IH859_06780, partial [Chloroflexi bacterium]|nr:hypothetical protein [Chloroflexota bacterium]